MKNKLIIIFVLLLLTSCTDSCNNDEVCKKKVENSFHCMWIGDCK